MFQFIKKIFTPKRKKLSVEVSSMSKYNFINDESQCELPQEIDSIHEYRYTKDDIINYVEEGDKVKAYFNQKVFDSCLYERAKENTNNFTIKDKYEDEKYKRAITLEDISKNKHSIHTVFRENEYVERGDVCLDLFLDLPYSYCKENNISEINTLISTGILIFSKYKGFINYHVKDNIVGICNLGNEIKDGDLLFTITLEEKPLKSINSIKLKYNLFDEDFSKEVSSLKFDLKWLVDDFSKVYLGDDIIKVTNGAKTTIIKSPYSGIIKKEITSILELKDIRLNSNLCTIYSSLSECKKLFPNEVLVNKDDFTNSVSITCEKYADYSLGFKLRSSTYINFEYVGNKTYLGLRYERKDINLNKKCSLHLLLEDNIVIILTPIANPIKLVDCPSHSILKFLLSPENLKQLEEKKFVKWQIINEDGLQISSGSNQCCCGYNDVNEVTLSLSQEVFRDFVIEFNRLIKENTPEEYDIQEESAEEIASNRNGTCCVYLMIDTTNNFHKIGISNNPRYREHTLQSDKPTIELVVAKEYPTRPIAEAIESALHKAYSSKRIRGEWFNLDKNDVAHIVETLK